MTRRLTKDTRRFTKPLPTQAGHQARAVNTDIGAGRRNLYEQTMNKPPAEPMPPTQTRHAPSPQTAGAPTSPPRPIRQTKTPCAQGIRPRPQPTAASQCIRVHPRSSAANRPSLPNHEPRPHPPAPQHAEHRTKTPCTQSQPARRRDKTPCARTPTPKDAHKNPMRPGNHAPSTAPTFTPDQSPQHTAPKPHAPRANPNPFPSAPRRARIPPCQSSSPNRSITSPT